MPGTEYGQEVPSTMYVARRIGQRHTNGGTVDIDYDRSYEINTGTFRPDSVQLTAEGITKAQAYTYGSANHLQATQISDLYDNGEVYSHHLTFTVDQASSPTTNSLITRNIVLPTTDLYQMNGKNVSRSKTIYATWGAQPRPLYIYSDYYDASGIFVRDIDQVKSYNGVGLMTAVRRHGYTIDDVFAYDGNSLMTSAGPTGLTRSFAYHAGSHLISSITGVDGISTTYDYDGLMRVQKITDAVGASTEWDYHITTGVTAHTSYIKTTATFPADANGLSSLVSLEGYAYLDGLGRTIQTVGKAQTYGGKDQISALQYDAQGRTHRSYEPYATTVSTGAYSNTFWSEPYTETTFEASPLSRPITVTPPVFGTQEYSYGLNTTAITGADAEIYPIGTLYQRTAIDGNGNKSQSFTDIQGRTILSRRADATETAASFIDTRTDYDWRNLPLEIVPPGSTLASDSLNFIYEYDREGRTLRKKVPSKDWVNLVYDSRDLLIGYQDSYLRAQSSDKWYIYKYDDWGRELASGYHGSQPASGGITPGTVLTSTVYGTSAGTSKGKVSTTSFTLLDGSTDQLSQTFFMILLADYQI